MSQDELAAQDYETRNAFWAEHGERDPYVMAPIANPGFMGGVLWPNIRQSVTFTHTAKGTIVSSDGLSDPWHDYDTNEENRQYNGVGLELYLKTDARVSASDPGWQGSLVYLMANQAAELAGRLWSQLDQYGLISFELPNVAIPEEFMDVYLSDRGTFGILLGSVDSEIPSSLALSIEPIKLVKITLITKSELQHAIEEGAEGRQLISDRLAAQYGDVSILRRASVV